MVPCLVHLGWHGPSQMRALQRSGSQENNFVELGTNNPQAYEAFARGRFFLNKAGPDDLRKAIDHFEQAVGLRSEHSRSVSAHSQ